MQNEAIVVNNLSKTYALYQRGWEKYVDFLLPGNHFRQFAALQDVSMTALKGQSIGLLGMNGSGKSTLANIIAGISAPSSGTVTVNGEVGMTSVSGGLNVLLTGEENIFQKCLLLGMDHKEIKEIMPQIVEFSELGSFIKQQAKTYSSGMRAKLAFAISVNIDPDIIVIDEALSVGDPTFTDKCLKKMQEFREKGTTIIFVSHALPQVRDFCDHALWLEGGKNRMFGECNEVIDEYEKFIRHYNTLSKIEQKAYKDQIHKSRMVEISRGRK